MISAPTNSRTNAFHHFLRLTQPINDESLPASRVAEAGRTYKFPFHFVVPERLLPQSCIHPKECEQVHNGHLELPPSLGDPMLVTDGHSLLDDLAPDMTTISYAIKVRIVRRREEGGKPLILVDSAKKLRIIPATHEQPPLNIIDRKDDDYILRREKMLNKRMFRGKLGQLTMETSQSKSLNLSLPRSESSCSSTTMATVNLRFDPADDGSRPPRLGQLWNRIKVATFFGTLPMSDFPTMTGVGNYESQRGLFVKTLNLSSRCVTTVQWEQHTSSHPLAATSFSSMSSREPLSAYTGRIFYTARLLVPITLPTHKMFPPTFHSCLISRIYALDFSLSVHTPSATGLAQTMQLKVPLQILSTSNVHARLEISAAEAQAIAAREFDGSFSSRSVALPSPEYTERAEITQLLSQSQDRHQSTL